MATYVLIHGAGDSAFYWHLLAPVLRERGQGVVAVDLPCDDESAGLSEYTDAVVEAIGDRTELVLVAQSFGAFTAPLVCARVAVELMVLVAGMVPMPGEKGADWSANTGFGLATSEQHVHDNSEIAVFYHDVAPPLAAQALSRGRDQAQAPGLEPWPLDAWPDVATKYLLCRDDRFFPAQWMRAIVRERLGINARRNRQRPLPRPQPPEGAGRALGGVPGRTADFRTGRSAGVTSEPSARLPVPARARRAPPASLCARPAALEPTSVVSRDDASAAIDVAREEGGAAESSAHSWVEMWTSCSNDDRRSYGRHITTARCLVGSD